jgi:hypothetical protein
MLSALVAANGSSFRAKANPGTAVPSTSASDEKQFSELPPELPLPSTPPRGTQWTKNAIVLQPWGYTQRQVMNPGMGELPLRLKRNYGFNTMCVMPPPALEAVGGGEQSEEEFTDALDAYRKAGYKLILYSSLVNVGHDPAWYRTLKDHPDWRQIDASGKSKAWLCPNTGAFEGAITYTKKIVGRYQADGVMLDNNAFMDTGRRAPSCYCQGCEEKFRTYVATRFGPSIERYLGVSAEAVQIPRTNGPLYNLWKQWRNRSWVETMERAREALPDIVLFANTQYWYWTSGTNGWFLAHDRLYSHEDTLLSESYFMEPAAVSAKMILGRALANERPLFDLVGTFEWKPPKYSTLKPGPLIQRLTAAVLMHGANPWLGYYGMESDGAASEESRRGLSQLLSFRTRYPEFYAELREWSSVCSILPLGSYTLLGTDLPVVPKHVRVLSDAGITTAGICDLMLRAETLARFQIAVAENISSLSANDAAVLAGWVRNGGKLIASPDLGSFDEIGRRRPGSVVAARLGMKALTTTSVGKGELLVIPAREIPNKVLDLSNDRIQVTEVSAGTVEVRAYNDPSGRLFLHIINYGRDMEKPWKLRLPARLASSVRSLVLRRPEDQQATTLRVSENEIKLPPIAAYAVIEISRSPSDE